MAGYEIGLAGLQVAQKAIQIIGNNIANAATEGYHRQEAVISPIPGNSLSTLATGQGAEVIDIRRLVDELLEQQIRRQQPELGQVSQELVTLQSLETVLGNLTTGGLAGALDDFLGALGQLASEPDSAAYRSQVVGAGEALAAEFRLLGSAIRDLEMQVASEARQLADEVNRLAQSVAEANGIAVDAWARGGSDSNLLDLRDQAVAELADLVDIQVRTDANGAANLQLWGTPLVLNRQVSEIEINTTGDGTIGVAAKGSAYADTTVRGGRLGGMLALANDLLPRVQQEIDALARAVMQQVNRCHVQGVGTAGSFTELTGQPVGDSPLARWAMPVTAGDIRLRVINTATGEVTRYTVTIADPATETAADVAAAFSTVANLSANVAGGCLRLQAAPGFAFDFLPALLPDPATSTLTGTAAATLSGVYGGSANQTFTATVVGTGEVGATSSLTVEVRSGAGELVRTLNVGTGYAAGDALAVADGLSVAISQGTLNDGEQFTFEALADSDPTGLLAAAGLNTFFVGDSAETMAVAEPIRQSSSRLATTLSTDGIGNLNVRRMLDAAQAPAEALGGETTAGACRNLVSTIGQWVALRQARSNTFESILRELTNRRDDLGGVDINEEAANLLVFERMFQGAAKYLAAVDQAYQVLMDIL